MVIVDESHHLCAEGTLKGVIEKYSIKPEPEKMQILVSKVNNFSKGDTFTKGGNFPQKDNFSKENTFPYLLLLSDHAQSLDLVPNPSTPNPKP